jgi:hypothetical protein
MAVLKPYRGLNLPLYMLLEANRLYIAPGNFKYTWLLFQGERAISSKFCTMLGFSASSKLVHPEQGPSRVLMRDERSRETHVADMQTRSFLDTLRPGQFEIMPVQQTFAAVPELRTGTRR